MFLSTHSVLRHTGPYRTACTVPCSLRCPAAIFCNTARHRTQFTARSVLCCLPDDLCSLLLPHCLTNRTVSHRRVRHCPTSYCGLSHRRAPPPRVSTIARHDDQGLNERRFQPHQGRRHPLENPVLLRGSRGSRDGHRHRFLVGRLKIYIYRPNVSKAKLATHRGLGMHTYVRDFHSAILGLLPPLFWRLITCV